MDVVLARSVSSGDESGAANAAVADSTVMSVEEQNILQESGPASTDGVRSVETEKDGASWTLTWDNDHFICLRRLMGCAVCFNHHRASEMLTGRPELVSIRLIPVAD
jgi:hypothetical protein